MKNSIASQIRTHKRSQGSELSSADVGTIFEILSGFGLVQRSDVGKKVWLKPYGIVIENNEQRDTRKKRLGSNPPTCKLCGGPKLVLGSLGWRRHYRCRDCGAESSQMVRRPKPKKKNPTRRRASTKRILGAWMRAKSGKGSMALHKKAARRMGLKASMFIKKNGSRRRK